MASSLPGGAGLVPARRPVDAVALAHQQRRLQRAAEPPWLHAEVARRMAERLPLIKQQPERVIDWNSFLGASQSLLRAAYPRAVQVLVEPDAARRDATAAAMRRPWWSRQHWGTGASPQVLLADALPAAHGRLLWANMALHLAADPQAVLRQWQRAVAVDGFLMFSTLGPGSLLALRSVYAAQRWPAPFAPFVDMHDLGDMLVEAGFADPVMDQEIVTLTWASPDALLAELRALGGNADPHRGQGLRTPRWRRRLCNALAATSDADGRIALQFEVVYGHAFRPAPRPRLAAQTVVPLEDLRAMVRAGRADAPTDPSANPR